MSYKFKESEIKEIQEFFPLKFSVESGLTVLEGRIDINAEYEGIIIKDGFDIKILVPNEYPEQIPVIIEAGKRIEKIAKKRNISNIRDLHCNDPISKIVCLCAKPEEKIKFPEGSSFVQFMNNLVVPFFYSISFFENYGYWPWGDYSHGNEGNIEWYLDNRFPIKKERVIEIVEILKKDKKWNVYKMLLKADGFIRSHTNCSCGSILKFRNCHPKALNGLQSLKVDIANLNIGI